MTRSLIVGALLVLGLAACAAPSPSSAPAANISWKDCSGTLALTGVPANLPQCLARSGLTATQSMNVRLGQSVDEMDPLLRAGFSDSSHYFTDEPTTVRWQSGDDEYVFENVGGTGETVLLLDLSFEVRQLRSISFAWQNRPLALPEVMERAHRFEQWLTQAGYAPLNSALPADIPFTVFEEMRPPTRHADNWRAAEALLAADSENVERMGLYTLTRGDTIVNVQATNMRRGALNFQNRGSSPPLTGFRRTIFDGNGGYEWLLEINIRQRDAYDRN